VSEAYPTGNTAVPDGRTQGQKNPPAAKLHLTSQTTVITIQAWNPPPAHTGAPVAKQQQQQQQPSQSDTSSADETPVSILYWESSIVGFMGKHMLGQPPRNCPIKCDYHVDKDKYATSDAVVFHIPAFANFPAQPKPPGQQWVAYSMESDKNYPLLADDEFMQEFDVEMSYRLKSDVLAGYWSHNMSLFLTPPGNKVRHMCACMLIIVRFCVCLYVCDGGHLPPP
jgi:hypothetical protein